MPDPNICPICGDDLIGTRIYCSKDCKNKSQIRRIELTCEGCGKKFLNLPYLKRKTNYCSLDCYWNSTRAKEKRYCSVCRREFIASGTQVRKGFGLFCSRKCQQSTYPKRILKKCLKCNVQISVQPCKKHLIKFCSKTCADDYRRDYLQFTCKQCKKLFEIPRSDFNRGRGIFCTWVCFIKYKGSSSLEEKVMKVLDKEKINYQREVKFKRFYVDFVIEAKKLAIECDGEFWHMQEKIKERDARKEKLLESLGYRVLRLSGQMINKHTETQLARLIISNY